MKYDFCQAILVLYVGIDKVSVAGGFFVILLWNKDFIENYMVRLGIYGELGGREAAACSHIVFNQNLLLTTLWSVSS